MPRAPRWNDQELQAAVAASRSLAEVSRRLAVRPGGGTYRSSRRHIARLQLAAGHISLPAEGPMPPRRHWTDDDLATAVKESSSIAGVLRTLGYRPSGGMHRFISAHIRRLELDTEHFTGQGWARGRRRPTGPRRPLEEILVANSTYSSGHLRRRLLAAGLKDARCEICGLETWRGQPLPLALDHINGDPCDNRLVNLRIVCPNCHALTETWCARNRRPAYSNWQRGCT